MLFLLQKTMTLLSAEIIQQNQQFAKTGHKHHCTYAFHDNDIQRVILNIWKWHNADKDRNRFDGDLLFNYEQQWVNILYKIGGVRKSQAVIIRNSIKDDYKVTIDGERMKSALLELLASGEITICFSSR